MSTSSLGNCTIYSTCCIMVCLVIPIFSLLLFIQSLYSNCMRSVTLLSELIASEWLSFEFSCADTLFILARGSDRDMVFEFTINLRNSKDCVGLRTDFFELIVKPNWESSSTTCAMWFLRSVCDWQEPVCHRDKLRVEFPSSSDYGA